MRFIKFLAIAALTVAAAAPVLATSGKNGVGTAYICNAVSPTKRDKAHTFAVILVFDTGEAVASDAWSSPKDAVHWTEAKIGRNDSQALVAGWTTRRMPSDRDLYARLNRDAQ